MISTLLTAIIGVIMFGVGLRFALKEREQTPKPTYPMRVTQDPVFGDFAIEEWTKGKWRQISNHFDTYNAAVLDAQHILRYFASQKAARKVVWQGRKEDYLPDGNGGGS